MDFGEWFHLTKYAHSSCHSLPLNLRRSNPGGYSAEACSRRAEVFFFLADLVELVQHSLMLAFSCFCSGWHLLCAPSELLEKPWQKKSELLALNGCLTFQTQCIARCLALAGVSGPPKAHVLNASQLRMAQHTVQYHDVSCVSSIFNIFRHIS